MLPQAKSHMCSARPCPSHTPFTVWSFCPHLRRNSFPSGTNVTISGHISHWASLACEGTPSMYMGILKVMSTWIFVNLTGYCHIWFPMRESPHVDVGRMTKQWRRRRRGGARPNTNVIYPQTYMLLMFLVGNGKGMPTYQSRPYLNFIWKVYGSSNFLLVDDPKTYVCFRCVKHFYMSCGIWHNIVRLP